MAGRFVVTLTDANNQGVGTLDAFAYLDYALVQNEICPLTMRFASDAIDINSLTKDGRVYVERAAGESPLRLEGQQGWVIRDIFETDDSEGNSLIELQAYSGEHVLDRRIIAYNSGNTYSDKVDAADTLMYEYVYENLGAGATDATRRITDWLNIPTPNGLGPVVYKEASRRELLKVLQELSAQAAGLGSWVGFGMVADMQTGIWTFQTFINQRGADRSSGAGLVEVSKQAGSLVNTRIGRISGREKNAIYAAGGGIAMARAVRLATDDAAIVESPINRCEYLQDCGNTSDPDVLASEGEAALFSNRGQTVLTGDLVESDALAYGDDYYWGDLLLASRNAVSVAARVDVVHVTVENKVETIRSSVRGTL